MNNDRKNGGTSRRRIPLLAGIGTIILLTLLVMVLSRSDLLYELELKSYDARFLLRGTRAVEHSPAVIIAVDDEAFATLPYRWPFPRGYFARLIENLFAAGVSQIVFDIQFTEPSSPVQDSLLAAATALHADSIIHAGKIVFRHDERLDRELTHALLPIQELMATGAAVGIVNEVKDRDGFTRQYPIYEEHGEKNWLPLALKAAQIWEGLSDSVQMKRGPDRVRFGPFKIPRMARRGEGTFLINYYGPTGTFPTYSIADVLDTEDFDLRTDDTDYMKWYLMSDAEFGLLASVLPPDAVETFRQMRDANPFEGKIAFIGASAAELQDLKRTPFYAYSAPGQERRFREMPGVEVHVNAFQTLLDGTYIRNVPVLWEAGLVLLLMLGVFLLSNRTNLTIATIGSAALVLLITVVDYYLFIQHRTWLALVAPVLGIILAYIATTAWQYILEQKEKAMIRGMFSQYVPKKVVDELIVNPDMLKLGGERRRMTVLFTDIAGFTAISERLNPEEIVQLLNDYLSAMSQIILDNEGIIDKYEGDLIMAEWGAPVYFEEHAVYACRSALKMQRRLAELRKEWKAQGMPELQSRIGINTGHMVVGNMGCLEVFDYTVMGDAVNLASRLEGANRLYLSTIMVGEETYEDVKDRFVLRELDTIRVRGRAEAARVYELLAEKEEDLPPGRLEALRLYGEALDLYREGKFQEALEPLEKAIQAYPADGPSRALQRRCEQFVQSPPDRIWDGIWMLTEK